MAQIVLTKENAEARLQAIVDKNFTLAKNFDTVAVPAEGLSATAWDLLNKIPQIKMVSFPPDADLDATVRASENNRQFKIISAATSPVAPIAEPIATPPTTAQPAQTVAPAEAAAAATPGLTTQEKSDFAKLGDLILNADKGEIKKILDRNPAFKAHLTTDVVSMQGAADPLPLSFSPLGEAAYLAAGKKPDKERLDILEMLLTYVTADELKAVGPQITDGSNARNLPNPLEMAIYTASRVQKEDGSFMGTSEMLKTPASQMLREKGATISTARLDDPLFKEVQEEVQKQATPATQTAAPLVFTPKQEADFSTLGELIKAGKETDINTLLDANPAFADILATKLVLVDLGEGAEMHAPLELAANVAVRDFTNDRMSILKNLIETVGEDKLSLHAQGGNWTPGESAMLVGFYAQPQQTPRQAAENPVIRLFHEKGEDISPETVESMQKGDRPVFKFLRDVKAELVKQDSLVEAVAQGDRATVEKLRAEGVSFEVTEDGKSLLQIAAKNGRADLIPMLAEILGALSVNRESEEGFTALDYAVQENQLDSIKSLRSLKGAAVRDYDTLSKGTWTDVKPETLALVSTPLDKLMMLMDQSIDDEGKFTPVKMPEIKQLLTDPNLRSRLGELTHIFTEHRGGAWSQTALDAAAQIARDTKNTELSALIFQAAQPANPLATQVEVVKTDASKLLEHGKELAVAAAAKAQTLAQEKAASFQRIAQEEADRLKKLAEETKKTGTQVIKNTEEGKTSETTAGLAAGLVALLVGLVANLGAIGSFLLAAVIGGGAYMGLKAYNEHKEAEAHPAPAPAAGKQPEKQQPGQAVQKTAALPVQTAPVPTPPKSLSAKPAEAEMAERDFAAIKADVRKATGMNLKDVQEANQADKNHDGVLSAAELKALGETKAHKKEAFSPKEITHKVEALPTQNIPLTIKKEPALPTK